MLAMILGGDRDGPIALRQGNINSNKKQRKLRRNVFIILKNLQNLHSVLSKDNGSRKFKDYGN